jgi:hypothetical protein
MEQHLIPVTSRQAKWIDTIVVSAYKDGKWVFAAAHTGGDPAELAWIPESLTFD